MGRIEERVGERIKATRLRRRPPLRLADLAGDGLSLGMLSKIERGRVSPSLTTLQYLAQRLGVPLAQLFEEESETAGGTAALGDARAALWLGDPVGAAERALALVDEAGREPGGGALTHGSAGRVGSGGAAALLKAAALGIAAEAFLERDHAASAAAHLMAASAILKSLTVAGPVTPVDSVPEPVLGGVRETATPPGPVLGVAEGQAPLEIVVQAHLSWVLGLLERRRGQAAQAQRSWSHCLELLESDDVRGPGLANRGSAAGPPGVQSGPVTAVLRARALLELGGLHEALAAWETARNFHARAGAIVRWIADPVAVARSLLAPAGGSHEGTPPSTPGGSPQGVQMSMTVAAPLSATSGTESAAEVLAAVCLARRLAEQVTQSLARLDRVVLRRPTATLPEVPHSRHLR